MNFMNILETASDLLIPVALLALLTFIFLYAKNSPWRKHAEGRTLMYQYISWAAYLSFIIASVYFPDFYGREVVRFCIYVFITISFWTMTINLHNVQLAYKKKKGQKMSEIKTVLVPTEDLPWLKKVQPYTKFILACISAVGVSGVAAWFEGGVTPTSAITALVAVLGAVSIYAAPNSPKAGTTNVEAPKGATIAVIPATDSASEVRVVNNGYFAASVIIPQGEAAPESIVPNGGM